MVNLERGLYEILQRHVSQGNMSASNYLRKLVIEDLQKEGLLPTELLLSIIED